MASDTDLGQRVYSNVDGADGRVQAKIVGHATDPTLGAGAQFQQLVDADGNARVLVQGNDENGDNQTVRLSKQGAVGVDGVYDAINNPNPALIGLVGMTRNAAPGEADQVQRVTVKPNADGSVRSLDISLHDEAGEPYTTKNPLPCVLSESEGQEVANENTAVDLAAAATDTHDYSVANGASFRLKQVLAGCAGDFKMDILIGDGASPEVFTRKALRYGTPSKDASVVFAEPIVVAGTVNTTTVRVIRTNKDNKQTDVSTTIVGVIE